jgi:hypothetical protein
MMLSETARERGKTTGVDKWATSNDAIEET